MLLVLFFVLLIVLLLALGDFLAFGLGEILPFDFAFEDFLAFGFFVDFALAFVLAGAVGAAEGLTDVVGLVLGAAVGLDSVLGALTVSLTLRPASRCAIAGASGTSWVSVCTNPAFLAAFKYA